MKPKDILILVLVIWILALTANLNTYRAESTRQLKAQQDHILRQDEVIKQQAEENARLKTQLQSQRSVSSVVYAISKIETNQGKTGVGRGHCNNPTGIAGKCFATLAEGYAYSQALWQRGYAHLPIESALAKWKTGKAGDRTDKTLEYIAKVKRQLEVSSG